VALKVAWIVLTSHSEWAIDIIGGNGDKDWPKIWEESEQNKKLAKEIEKVKQERKSKPVAEDVDRTSKYAASTWTQTQQLFKRTFTGYYRDVPYIMGKLFLHIFTAFFNGLTFLQLGNAVIDNQVSTSGCGSASCADHMTEHPLLNLHLPHNGTAAHSTTATAIPSSSRLIRSTRRRRENLLLGAAHRVCDCCRVVTISTGGLDLLCDLVEPRRLPWWRTGGVWPALR
jgi:hypothetical protein